MKFRLYRPLRRGSWTWSFTVSGVLLLYPWLAHACNNPELHPGIAEFTAVAEALRSQPPSPVELKYRIEGERRAGTPVSVRFSFWPNAPYDSGRFSVTPSAGLKLASFSGGGEIPYKGTIDFDVIPTRSGYHYLKVETVSRQGEAERRRTFALALPVGLTHPDPADTQQQEVAKFGFAGSRLREGLLARQGIVETGVDARRASSSHK